MLGGILRAWQLGVILIVIGGLLFYWKLPQLLSWLYWGTTDWLVGVIGLLILSLGLWILGAKFRQWVLHH
jgi:hypothetical protein